MKCTKIKRVALASEGWGCITRQIRAKNIRRNNACSVNNPEKRRIFIVYAAVVRQLVIAKENVHIRIPGKTKSTARALDSNVKDYSQTNEINERFSVAKQHGKHEVIRTTTTIVISLPAWGPESWCASRHSTETSVLLPMKWRTPR